MARPKIPNIGRGYPEPTVLYLQIQVGGNLAPQFNPIDNILCVVYSVVD